MGNLGIDMFTDLWQQDLAISALLDTVSHNASRPIVFHLAVMPIVTGRVFTSI